MLADVIGPPVLVTLEKSTTVRIWGRLKTNDVEFFDFDNLYNLEL